MSDLESTLEQAATIALQHERRHRNLAKAAKDAETLLVQLKCADTAYAIAQEIHSLIPHSTLISQDPVPTA